MRSCARNRGNPLTALVAVLTAGLVVGNCSAARQAAVDAASRARAAVRNGDYSTARAAFESALRSNPEREDLQAGLLEVLRLTGEYGEAEKRAAAFLMAREAIAGVHLESGRVAALRGDYARAEKHFRRSIGLPGARGAAAVRDLAELLESLGRRDEARPIWEGVVERYRKGELKGSADLGVAAVAAWRLGFIRDARDIFMDATGPGAAGDASLEAYMHLGRLFLEKYNETDALGVFRDCLKINPSYPDALLGMALAKKFESNDEVEKYALAALKVNPSLVPAIALLAELRMEEEDYAAAKEAIDRALAINPASLEILTLEAVYYRFRGEDAAAAATEKRVLGINPRYGELYQSLAENLVMRRKYREAVEYSRRAVELRPDLWVAHASLGMNLMRVGELAEGRKAIQRAFDGDPFNVWAYNTLELLDQMDKFVRTRSENLVYLMDRDDQPIIAPYASALAEEAYRTLSRRYGFTPSGPLQLEIFPDHGGFAVRTLGLPGLGALGVCFGKVIALDSPRARKAGSFNWGSALWHEFAHVITLQMTNHNIPRWYSEGISVYEERRARPGWGDDLTAAFVRAYSQGRLLKASELNAGLMRPRFPEQVAFSYYQASLVCELIEERFGFAKIRETLRLFAENKRTEEVFRQALGWDASRLDSEYARYLDARLKPLLGRLDFRRLENRERPEKQAEQRKGALTAVLEKNPDDFFANLELGTLLRREKANRSAEPCLRKAQALFPEYTEPGNPYQLLADMYLEEDREDEALEQLLGWTRYDENEAAPLVRAAAILMKRQDHRRAKELLERSVFVRPYDVEALSMLVECAAGAGDWSAAVIAARAVLGLNPADPARAHFNLARALLGSGDRQQARREVLRALEIAPSFPEAQDLLLKLRGGEP